RGRRNGRGGASTKVARTTTAKVTCKPARTLGETLTKIRSCSIRPRKDSPEAAWPASRRRSASQRAGDVEDRLDADDGHHHQVDPAEPRIPHPPPAQRQAHPDENLAQDHEAHVEDVDTNHHVGQQAVEQGCLSCRSHKRPACWLRAHKRAACGYVGSP